MEDRHSYLQYRNSLRGEGNQKRAVQLLNWRVCKKKTRREKGWRINSSSYKSLARNILRESHLSVGTKNRNRVVRANWLHYRIVQQSVSNMYSWFHAKPTSVFLKLVSNQKSDAKKGLSGCVFVDLWLPLVGKAGHAENNYMILCDMKLKVTKECLRCDSFS